MVIPPSPDAASLGVYGVVPVSTYTGIPNISIPLYNIEYRDISLPINLSYHASGITVDQDASWVGLGWVLNIGGVITRTIRGGDDLQFSNDGISNLNGGQVFYQGFPYDEPVDIGEQIPESALTDICERYIDPEPDIFHFNFLGQSGRFILEQNQDHTLTYVAGTPLESQKMSIKYDKVNYRWEIKTADGYTYLFGTKELTETHHGSGGGFKVESDLDDIKFDPQTMGFLTYDDINISSWYLDKIISPMGTEVIYVYDLQYQGNKSLYGSSRLSMSHTKVTQLELEWNPDNWCGAPGEEGSDRMRRDATKIFTNHIFLKEVQFGSGKIVLKKSQRDDMIPPQTGTASLPQYLGNRPFFLSWIDKTLVDCYGAQKLDEVEISDKLGNVIKKIEFKYGYFNNDKVGAEQYEFKRLRLDMVRECGQDVCKPYHVFSYDQVHSLPSKYSNAQDLWGYYNGAHNNISLIPHGTYVDTQRNKFFHLGTSDRQPNASYMKSGTINRITYPTGGSIEFEFEPHDYSRFGDDAFRYTDFENTTNSIPIGYVGSTELDPTYQSMEFELTDPMQELVIDETMTYYALRGTSLPCQVEDPGRIHMPNVIWYSVVNVETNTTVVSQYMSDYLNYFMDTYKKHCQDTYTPDEIVPEYINRRVVTLGPGNYEVRVYGRDEFNLDIALSKNVIHPREVQLNGHGVASKLAGGLRIKRISKSDDETSITQVINYDYTEAGEVGIRSSGKLMLYPNNFMLEKFGVTFSTSGGGGGAGFCAYNLTRIKGVSWSFSPLATSASGSIVGYDQVTETLGVNGQNGKTVYRYWNDVEEPQANPFVIAGMPTITKTSNGLIDAVKYYDATGRLLKEEQFTYERQLAKIVKGIASKEVQEFHPMEVNTGCHFNTALQAYIIVSDRWVQTRKIQSNYSEGSSTPATIISNFVYDTQSHLQLESEEKLVSGGDKMKTIYTYPPNATWVPQGMWQNTYLYTPVVQKQVFRNTQLLSTYKANYVQSGEIFVLTEELDAIRDASLESSNIYSYYTNGNLKEITSRDGIVTTYLWGYNSAHPVAVIKNATFEEVRTALGNLSSESIETMANDVAPSNTYSTRIGQLRIKLSHAEVDIFTYSPLVGVISNTNSSGLVSKYKYDGLGRLVFVKDQNDNVEKAFRYHYKQ